MAPCIWTFLSDQSKNAFVFIMLVKRRYLRGRGGAAYRAAAGGRASVGGLDICETVTHHGGDSPPAGRAGPRVPEG